MRELQLKWTGNYKEKQIAGRRGFERTRRKLLRRWYCCMFSIAIDPSLPPIYCSQTEREARAEVKPGERQKVLHSQSDPCIPTTSTTTH